MALNTAYGFQNMLKEGHKHFSGLEEALFRNINACKEISKVTRTGLGPNGMKKMVINHIDKILVTSDAATIMKELEVQHPAAKMVVMAAKMQEEECGDGTNLVIALAGEFLSQAETLIKIGLHTSDIISGYELALKRSIELLEEQTVYTVEDHTNLEQVSVALKSALYPKLGSYSNIFSNLVADACIKACPRNKENFDVEFIRVAKIQGSSLDSSYVMKGLIVTRNAEGSISRVVKPRVACYGQPLDPQQGETKGTILINKAQELLDYTKSEEDFAEKIVKRIAEAKIDLVVSGGSVSELMMHYLEKYKIMVVRITSKFELKRICKALGATPLARLDAPVEEEVGHCDEVYVTEVGSQKITVFKRETETCNLSTIVLRGSTKNLLDDVERAIDDGVNIYRGILSDPRFVPGAGSIETIISSKLEQEAKKFKDLHQYSFTRFVQSFEIIPRILSDNLGLNTNEVLPSLVQKNQQTPSGIDFEKEGSIKPISEIKVYDHLRTKSWAIKLAADAAITILRVDQIIIARPAGGPKMTKPEGNWDEEN